MRSRYTSQTPGTAQEPNLPFAEQAWLFTWDTPSERAERAAWLQRLTSEIERLRSA